MSIWEHMFDNEYAQRRDISELQSRTKRAARRQGRIVSRTQSELEDVQARAEQLEEEVGELALLCRSLLSYLRERGQLDMNEFIDVIQRIDAEDGVLDGRADPSDPATKALSSLTSAEAEPPAPLPPPPAEDKPPAIQAPVPGRKRASKTSKYKKREEY